MTRARRDYVCWRCEHPILAGTQYHLERLDWSERGARGPSEFKAHDQRPDEVDLYSGDCDCAACPPLGPKETL